MNISIHFPLSEPHTDPIVPFLARCSPPEQDTRPQRRVLQGTYWLGPSPPPRSFYSLLLEVLPRLPSPVALPAASPPPSIFPPARPRPHTDGPHREVGASNSAAVHELWCKRAPPRASSRPLARACIVTGELRRGRAPPRTRAGGSAPQARSPHRRKNITGQ